MLAIQKARKIIDSNPGSQRAEVLTNLVYALQNNTPFFFGDLYDLEYKDFETGVQILEEWRMDRYYAKKQKLLEAVSRANQQESALR
jgi:hypothetical protein